MFKNAATKLAHSSTIPTLGGSTPIQDIITSEKLVHQSLQRLSADFGKTSDALRAWAMGEGEDLEDTFSACSTLLDTWISSIASFASHIARMRECAKAVRTEQEILEDMQRRRKTLASKIDSADKKLSKMSMDNKSRGQQIDALAGLREQAQELDGEIMKEEAVLGDLKRTKSREWMGILFGGLLECSEKGVIAAKYGRTIVGKVPTEKTPPGGHRAVYFGHARVIQLTGEAGRRFKKVSFTSDVGEKVAPPTTDPTGDSVDEPISDPGPPPMYSSPVAQPKVIHAREFSSLSSLPGDLPPISNSLGLGEFGEYQTDTPVQRTPLSPSDQLSPDSFTSPSLFSSPQGDSVYSRGHQRVLSESSISSGSGSVSSPIPITPPSLFSPIPQINPTTPGSESDSK